MQQVGILTGRGLPAACVIADCDEATKVGVQQGQYKIVFFSPEILLNTKSWRELLIGPIYSKRLRALVIDEAHTVKKWYKVMLNCYFSEVFCYLFRGESFRSVLLRVGEIRSLIPNETNVLALTATATTTLRKQVISILGMKDPHIVSICPSKDNIVYGVKEFKSVTETFDPILERLKSDRISTPRTIIFCERIARPFAQSYTNTSKTIWGNILLSQLMLQTCPGLDWLKCFLVAPLMV